MSASGVLKKGIARVGFVSGPSKPILQFRRWHLASTLTLYPLFETIGEFADQTRSLCGFSKFVKVPPASRINTSQAFLLGALCLEFRSTPLFLSTLLFSTLSQPLLL